jgi:hypothetical protein
VKLRKRNGRKEYKRKGRTDDERKHDFQLKVLQTIKTKIQRLGNQVQLKKLTDKEPSTKLSDCEIGSQMKQVPSNIGNNGWKKNLLKRHQIRNHLKRISNEQ